MKDASYWASLIKNKQISPQELLEETYKKAQQDKLNCFVKLDEEMYEESLRHIENIKNKDSLFFGVPFPLKNIGQNKKGWLNTAGARLMDGHVASVTDNYVLQVEASGLIPFGTTNAPEFGYKNVTDPVIYGVTKNAWNKEYHAGGSSGGAASAVASGIVPFAAASDGGGSIRIPASFSGLLGLKPSRGNVVTGPNGWRSWQGASVNFALGVSVRDARGLLEVLKPTQQISPFLMPKRLKNYKKNQPLKIAVCMDSPVGNHVSDEAKNAVKQSIKFLIEQGHEVIEIDYPINGDELIRSYYLMNGGETSAMMFDFKQSLKRELIIDDMELTTWTLYQYGEKLSAAEYAQSFNSWDKATEVMENLFETCDLFLSPTATTHAPKITDDFLGDELREKMRHAKDASKEELAVLVYGMFNEGLKITPYTQLANLTGQPSISLPTYVTSDGLPIGIQFMAAKGQDELLLDIAEIFEKHNQFILPKYYRKNA